MMIEALEHRTFFSGAPVINSGEISVTGRLPAAVLVAGQRISPIGQVVRITNTSGVALTGNTQIAVELSPDATGNSGGVTAASFTRKLNLRSGHSIAFRLVIRSIPLQPTGAVFLLAVVTDSSGNTATTASKSTITIASPVIDLAPIKVIAPFNVRPGRKQIVGVIVINNGNIAAVGPLAIDLKASTTNAIDSGSLDLGTTTRRIVIRPGKKLGISIAAKLPSAGGPYYVVAIVDPGNTFAESTLTNNQLASLTPSVNQASVAVQTAGSLTIKLTRLATVPAGDGTPQDIATAPGVENRQFITTRNGDILMLSNGALSPTPFLDTSTAGVSLYTGGEGGLFGLAFSPTFALPGTFGFDKFYTFDTEPFSPAGPAADFSSPELFPATNVQPNNQIVIREWSANSPHATTANLASRVLMRINHPQPNHQGGSLRFGPDGNLYIGLGDGGGANDNNGHSSDPADGHTNATGNAQDPSVVFGKILRINPNPAAGPAFKTSTNAQYSIPVSNPFATGGGLAEIYALGLRNPYRMSFDAATGSLYVGNVGQGTIESVDVVTNGGNYGWPYYEGTRNNQPDTTRTAPANFSFTTPIAEYTHADGDAIIGGVVDRSTAVPVLAGRYIFGDLGGFTNTVGRLFYTTANGGQISAFNYDPTGVIPSSNLYGFGIDSHGNPEALFSNGDILAVSSAK